MSGSPQQAGSILPIRHSGTPGKIPLSDTFDVLVNQFRETVKGEKGALENGTIARNLCGPNSLLTKLMPLLTGRPSEASVEKFQAALCDLDAKVRSNYMPKVRQQDPTLQHRWLALSHLIRSRIEKDSPRFGECLKEARQAFDRVWEHANRGIEWSASSVADGSPARATRNGPFSEVEQHLGDWTPGSWMVWDVLSQWDRSAAATATESTPVLFAFGAEGQVMRLVVELVPGPAGLVTPDWWQIGFGAFPFKENEPTRFLPRAVQAVMKSVATKASLRLRWHLSAGKPDPWKFGWDGESIEAAAAVVTLAVLEQHREWQQRTDKAKKIEPVLDANAVVTALVECGSSLDPESWPLKQVGHNTLNPKLVAAARHGLDVIAIPAEQPKDDVSVPHGVRVQRIETVGETLELLRAVNRALDRYGDSVRSEFKFHEEETPTTS